MTKTKTATPAKTATPGVLPVFQPLIDTAARRRRNDTIELARALSKLFGDKLVAIDRQMREVSAYANNLFARARGDAEPDSEPDISEEALDAFHDAINPILERQQIDKAAEIAAQAAALREV